MMNLSTDFLLLLCEKSFRVILIFNSCKHNEIAFTKIDKKKNSTPKRIEKMYLKIF